MMSATPPCIGALRQAFTMAWTRWRAALANRAWAVAWRMIKDNPVTGVGFDRFVTNHLDYEPNPTMEQKLGGDTLCAGVEKLGGVQVILKEFLVSGVPVVLLGGE